MGDNSISNDTASGDRVRERWRECGVPNTVVSDAITCIRSEAALHLGVLHLSRDLGTWFQLDG